MAWAIYSTPSDLAAYVDAAMDPSFMSPQDRNAANRYLQAGLSNWRNAPCIPSDHPCFATDGQDDGTGAGCMRVIQINNGTLADFRALLTTLANKYPQAVGVRSFLHLLEIPWYAVDPYPPAAGFFTGMTCT